MKLKLTSLAVVTAIMGAVAAPAQAEDLLKVLRDNGTITADQYEALKSDKATKTKLSKSLQFKSGDGAFKMKFGGRVMADYAFMDDKPDDTDSAARAYRGNASEIRRARLFVKGSIYNDWGYKLQLDFAGNESDLKDAYISYNGLKNTSITLGNQKVPFGLNELTSSKYITFMERSFVSEMFAAGRKNGLSVATHGKNWTVGVAAHMEDIDHDGDTDEDVGYTGRVTFAPLADKDKAIHLGVGYRYQDYKDNGEGEAEFAERPGVHTAGKFFKFKDKDSVVDNFDAYNLELAGVYHRFSAQAEYFDGSYSMKGNAKDLDADGFYILGSVFLTDDHRTYAAKKGEFGRVKPKSIVGEGGYGAVELAIRYDEAKIEQGSDEAKPETWTYGINWYATPNVRFMANYVTAENRSEKGEDFDAFQVRGQVDF